MKFDSHRLYVWYDGQILPEVEVSLVLFEDGIASRVTDEYIPSHHLA